jgi:uncharacterized protein HemY
MAAAQAQQSQIDQAHAQAAQAAQAAQTTLAANDNKKDITQELQKLASLRQQGILSEEEFQQMKARILSNILRFYQIRIVLQYLYLQLDV